MAWFVATDRAWAAEGEEGISYPRLLPSTGSFWSLHFCFSRMRGTQTSRLGA